MENVRVNGLIVTRLLAKSLRAAVEIVYVAVGVLLVALPLLLLSISPFTEHTSTGDQNLPWTILSRSGTQAILQRNAGLAIVTTVCCLAFAGVVVFLIRRFRARALLLATALLVAPLLTDPLARNYGWYFLLRTNGVVNNVLQSIGILEQPIQLLYRFESLILVMVQGLFPLAALPLLLASLHYDRRATVVGNALGASRWFVFRRVTMPLLAPGLLLGVCFVFTNSFGYYITPKMLGGDAGLTIAGLIDQRVNLLLDWGGATALAMMLVVIAVPFLIVFVRAFNRLEPITGFSAVPNQPLAGKNAAARIAIWLILILAVALPWVPLALTSVTSANFLSFPPSGFSLRWFGKALFDSDWSRCWYASIIVATLSALLATVVAAGAVSLASRWRKLTFLHLIIAGVPLLVPPIAMAIGMYRVMTTFGITDEWWRLILGHTVRVLPYPILSLMLAWKSLNPALVQATLVYGARSPRAWIRALRPHFVPAVLVGYLLAWITSFNDLEFALFLCGPNSTTLPIQIWSSLHYSVEPTVPACSVLTTVLGLFVLGMVLFFVRSFVSKMTVSST